MALTPISFTTPTGRLVAGSASKPQTKDADGKPLVIKTGPNAGQPTVKYYVALAIPKIPGQHWATYPRLETKPGEPSWGEAIWSAAHAYLQQASQMPVFAFKVTDGDSTVPNRRGNRPCDNEGWPGNWILHFSASYAPKTYNSDGSAMVPAESVKTGYYVQIAGSVVGNESSQNPGVYVNPSMIALRGYAKEIVSGPDASQAGFGGGALPPGASAMPPPGAMPAGAPPAPPAGAPQPPAYAPPPQLPPAGAPQPPAYAPPPAAGVPVAPPPVYVPPAGFPAPPVPPVPHPGILTPPVGPQVTAAANGATWAQLQASGWTEAVARQHGLIV